MVLDDPSFKKPIQIPEEASPEKQDEAFAGPADRLAAAIIDLCSVLLPIGLLAVAPFRKKMAETLLLQKDSDTLLVAVLGTLVFLFVVWVYHSIFHWKFGASIGKMFFGLRVVQYGSSEKPTFFQSATRSFVWIFELILFFPLLSVFSHRHRRSLHDRISDTIVLSPRRPASAPQFWEKSFVAGFYSALVVFFLIVGVGVFKGLLDELDDQSKLISLLEQNGELCNSVGKALKTWPEEKVSYGSERLSVAMAMFAAGIISKTCLAQEADYLSSQLKDEEPLLYLAQSFVHSDNAKLSNEYLDRVCELSSTSDSCIMSKIITDWAEEDWEQVDKHFSMLNDKTHLHIGVWAIRHMMKQKRFHEVLAYTDTISPQKSLASFLNAQRIKAYWNLNRFQEARALASGSLEMMDLYDSVDIAAWLCQEELEHGCQNVGTLSCKTLNHHMAGSQDLVVDTKLALAHVHQLECSEDSVEKLENLMGYLPQPRLRSYVEALVLNKEGESKEARSELRLLTKDKVKDDIELFARRRMVQWSNSNEAIDSIYEEWKKMSDDSEAWLKLGKTLFDKYHSMGVHARSLEVGRQLVHTPLADGDFYRSLILSAYHAGSRREAKVLLKSYQSFNWDEFSEGRVPASESEFQVVKRVLDQESSGK